MFYFGRRSRQAESIWGLEYDFDSTLFLFGLPWTDLDPDEYIFLHSSNVGNVHGLRDALFEHLRIALIAAKRLATSGGEGVLKSFTTKREWYQDSKWYRLIRKPTDDAREIPEAIEVLEGAQRLLASPCATDLDPLELTKIAFHSGFNPAALCPNAEYSHEFLCVAGWLGILWRGRSVVLPSLIAHYWLELLAGAHRDAPDWAPDAYLLQKAYEVIDRQKLLLACLKSSRSGAVIVRPRPNLRQWPALVRQVSSD
jgi:hypothetical protein